MKNQTIIGGLSRTLRSLSHPITNAGQFSTKKMRNLYDFDTNRRSLPEVDKRALSLFVVECLLPIVGVHPYPMDEQLLMCSAVAYFKPDIIMEWGTHKGHSARIFREAVNYCGLSAQLHSIDLPPNAAHEENIRNAKMRGCLIKGMDVQLHLGDGLATAISILAQARKSAVQDKLPMFFLDGDHAYESVKRELDGVREFCTKAVVLIHDTFYQSPEANYNVGPHQAVQEFTRFHNLPLYTTALGLPGMSLTWW